LSISLLPVAVEAVVMPVVVVEVVVVR